MKVAELVRQMEGVVVAAVDALKARFDSRHAALEARIVALETRAGIEAKAVEVEYPPGAIVTRSGVQWQCTAPGRWRKLEGEDGTQH